MFYYTWIGQKLLCVMKKTIPQVKPSPVADFLYETKRGLFIYCR